MYLFEIQGDPVPQKQTQFVRSTGIAYNPSKKDAERIQWQIKPYAPSQPLICAIELLINFYLPIPKSTSGIKKRQMMKGVIS